MILSPGSLLLKITGCCVEYTLGKSLVKPTWWGSEAYKELRKHIWNTPSDAADSHASELGSKFVLCVIWAWRWLQLWLIIPRLLHGKLSQRHRAKQTPDSWPLRQWGNKFLWSSVDKHWSSLLYCKRWYNFLKYLAIENTLFSLFPALSHESFIAFYQDANHPENTIRGSDNIRY